jgi:hypothetical protein
MENQILPQASLFLGIIPALLLLYVSLKGYDDYYKDKYIYLSFIAGLIAGIASILLEQATVAVGLLFIILFPLLEQLFKTIILNIKRLQENKETTIYGLSLGLGFGSIFIPFSILTSNIQSSDTISYILIIVGSLGIILMHGATGVIIGYGITIGKLPKYLFFAILGHIPLTSLILITTILELQYLQFMLVVYGLILYYYATTIIMPKIKIISERRKRISKTTS